MDTEADEVTDMDSNVAQFPDKASRSWRWMREELRALYLAKGHEAAGIDRSIEPVGEIYKRLRDAPPVPAAGGEEAVWTVEHWVQNLVVGLLIEIANREVELVNAGLRD